jgi:hypothetical protein
LKVDMATLWVALSLSVVSVLLPAVAARATVSTTAAQPATTSLILSISGPETNPDARQEITSKEMNLDDLPSTPLPRSVEELIDLNLSINTKYNQIFDIGLEPITEQAVAVDLNRILLTGADAGTAITGPDRRIQSIATLELVAKSLGSTTIARGNRFSSGSGLPLSLAAISVVLLGAGLISLALTALRRHT